MDRREQSISDILRDISNTRQEIIDSQKERIDLLERTLNISIELSRRYEKDSLVLKEIRAKGFFARLKWIFFGV